MTWENYPTSACRCTCHLVAPAGSVSEHARSCRHAEPPPDRSWLTTECENCGKTRHALGVYCYPVGFWLTGALFAAAIVAIVVATIVRICT